MRVLGEQCSAPFLDNVVAVLISGDMEARTEATPVIRTRAKGTMEKWATLMTLMYA
jgi:hypothetical protein